MNENEAEFSTESVTISLIVYSPGAKLADMRAVMPNCSKPSGPLLYHLNDMESPSVSKESVASKVMGTIS